MEIELNSAIQERLKALLIEKQIIEQRLNDIILSIADFNDIDKDSEVSLSNDLTKLIVNV